MSSRPRFSRARAASARPLRKADRARARARISAVRSSFRRTGGMTRRRALAIANTRTAGFLGLEKKFYDTTLAPTALNAPTDASAGEFDPSSTSMISTPAVGDGEQNRDGKRIVIKSVQVTGHLHTAGVEATTAPSAQCRAFVALVLDTQTNGAQLNSEDVFKNLSADATLATCPIRNLLFASRFRVLKSLEVDLTPPSLASSALNDFSWNSVSQEFDWFIPMDLPVNFNAGTTASVANVIDNSLHIIAYCTNGVSTPVISYNARIRFMG